ncbi:MAG: hypothetical protein WC663_05775 [Patescibacteria group bacterium]|jgi:hypothetical protein
MRKKSLILGVVFATLSCVFCFFGQAKASDWQFESLSRGVGVGPIVAIALDSNSKAHLVYLETTGATYYLKYATNASGSFVSETIDLGSGLGQYPSIAIDYNDKAHVSYYDYANSDLKYATNASGVWAASSIDTTGEVGMYDSIGVDSLGYVHISYYDLTNDDLKYATNSNGTGFTLSTIDSSSTFVGLFSSLTVDDYNKVHISYYDSANLSLKYITNSSGNFVAQTVDSGNVGEFSSIKIDDSDFVHISYYDRGNRDLKYANNMLGYWSNSTVDTAGDVGIYSSLVVDSNSRVRIGYYDVDNFDFKLANNVGTSFSTVAVSDIGDAIHTAEQPISLAMDSSNRLYVGLFYLHTYSPWDGEVKFADVLGPISPEVVIEAGKKYTNFKDVDLVLSATSNPTEMMLSEYSTFAGAEWETYNVNKVFEMSSRVGKKTIYVKFRDQWYAESATVSDSIKYLPNPTFVTKNAKSKEILIKKKNKKYTAQKFYLKFLKLPKGLKKAKYSWQVKRYRKYSKTYIAAKKNLIKEYWKIKGNFNKYKLADNFKTKFVFKYTKKQFKTLKNRNKGLSESSLVLKYYNVKEKKWHNLNAVHSVKNRTFAITLISPISWNEIYYAIGKK